MWKGIVALLTALPGIIRLLEKMEKNIQEQKVKRKVSEDIEKLGEAFDEKDPEKLREIFNS